MGCKLALAGGLDLDDSGGPVRLGACSVVY